MSVPSAGRVTTFLHVGAFAATLLAILIVVEFDLRELLSPVSLPLLAPVAAMVLTFVLARPWVPLASGILLSLIPLMFLLAFGDIAALADPMMGLAYQSLLLLTLALVLALPSGILAWRATKRGAPDAASRPSVAIAVVGIAFIGGMALTSAFASTHAATLGGSYDVEPDMVVELRAVDFVFAPADLTIPAGKLVEIVLHNEDSELHTFTYDHNGKRFDHDVYGSASARFLVKFDEPGTVKYWCIPHSTGATDDGTGARAVSGMVGTITVQ